MYILYMNGDHHECYHGTFERSDWGNFKYFRPGEGYWLVPGTDPEDYNEIEPVALADDAIEHIEEDETLEYMIDLLDSGEIDAESFRCQLRSVGYDDETIAQAISEVAA